MSTIDTSTWSPDSSLNTEIGGIPLTADASIQQTWQAIQMLMAALKGDTSAIELTINQPDGITLVATNQTLTVVDNGHSHTIANVAGLQTALDGKAADADMSGATASADGASGLVPAPQAGDQDKVLKGDGTWGNAPTPNLGTASRAVQTDANGVLAVSSVTAAELGHLSGVTSAVQAQLDAKAADSGVVHTSGAETVAGVKTFSDAVLAGAGAKLTNLGLLKQLDTSALSLGGGSEFMTANGARIELYGSLGASNPGKVIVYTGKVGNAYSTLSASPDGTLTWKGQPIQTSSDERLKTPLSAVPDEVLDAWGNVSWGQFQFLDAVDRKGESARLHLGLIAQRVKAAFDSRGLDACAYGILCHEPDEDVWTVRYAEALAMEAACQRRRADRLEARIAALEEAMR